MVKRPVCQRVSWNCFVQLKWKLSKVSDENSLVWPILVVNGFGEANLLQGCTPSYAHQLSSDLLALPNEWWIVLFLFFHILPINTYYNGWLAHKWWIGILCYFIFSYIYTHISPWYPHSLPWFPHPTQINDNKTVPFDRQAMVAGSSPLWGAPGRTNVDAFRHGKSHKIPWNAKIFPSYWLHMEVFLSEGCFSLLWITDLSNARISFIF